MQNKFRRVISWLITLVMILGVTNSTTTVQASASRQLSADDLVAQTLTSSLIVGDFTLMATADKSVVIDGSVVANLAAPGASLSNEYVEVEAGDYYIASPSSGINIYGITLEPIAVQVIKTLDVSSMDIGRISASQSIDIFTIMATEAKFVDIDASAKSADDGTMFTQRMKLGGTGTKEERSIQFSTSAESSLKVYAMSSSSSADRKIVLYDNNGNLIKEMDAFGASIVAQEATVPAGDYYLASPASGVNVYKVVVTSGTAPVVVRRPWTEVTSPVITHIAQSGSTVTVSFDLQTDSDHADKANVIMYDSEGTEVRTVLVGKTNAVAKTATFTVNESGLYTFKVEAMRNDEVDTKFSASSEFMFFLPLSQPVIRAFNNANGTITVKWFSVEEAESYQILYKATGEEAYSEGPLTTELLGVLTELELDSVYDICVKAVRGGDETVSEVINKRTKLEMEREWNFTYFGQSVSSSRNTFEMINSEELTFKLNSCTIKADGITIDGKGGKFTTFHDGISYYYTEVNPLTENFVLTADFFVDYINSTPDGQEGFGLLAMDNLGSYGVSSVNHYTNSAGVIATKFEETIDEVKYTGKDVIGTRFVTGITPEVLALGDSGIAENGKNVSRGYGYETEDLVETGRTYTLTLKKTNTGYHASMEGEEERILYGVDKLLQLDPTRLYVGFAVARGCNVTVSNVSFTTTNPVDDPLGLPEPAIKVPYKKRIDSPTTSGSTDYTFVYASDVPGTLTVHDATHKKLVDSADITANVDFKQQFKLTSGLNSYTIVFTPDADFSPGINEELDSYEPITLTHNVTHRSFADKKIYVSSSGTVEGTGTIASPVDIYTATKYVKAGQIIQLAGGIYTMTEPLMIQRGIDGINGNYISLVAEDHERAVLDFENASGGIALWGDYWFVENIDVTKTPGNTKGLQVAGSDNIISQVNAYNNGDTGIQISGTGAETFAKWPANNLIINCTSYDNIDPGMNNADGFAAKITVADGNVFRGCVAYNNLDDGWDLFAKIETGPIGVVVIDNCLAFNNGTLTNGVGNGDGNGFKLGGDGIAVAHELMNSIAYNNNNDGITSNSNPSVIVKNVTSYGNKGKNLTLYGKGNGDRYFELNGIISMGGVSEDNITEMPSLASDNNYLNFGAAGKNASAHVLTSTIFVSTNMTILPVRKVDGSINMNGLFELNELGPDNAGARITDTPMTIKLNKVENSTNSVPPNNDNDGKVVAPTSNRTLVIPKIIIDEEKIPEVLLINLQVINHWAEIEFKRMISRGIIRSSDTFEADDTVSKNSMIIYMMRALLGDLSEYTSIEEQEATLLATAIESGWIQGDGNGSFAMEQKLSRETAMVILARLLRQQTTIELQEVNFELYEDLFEITEWAKEDVYFVVRTGLFRGRSVHRLSPKDEITYAELFTVIGRLHQLFE
jgi:pectate disaccharide-lyase